MKKEDPSRTIKTREAELPSVKYDIPREMPKGKGLKIKDKIKLKLKPDSSFLIEMKFSNGTSKTFVISTRNELFKFKGRSYHLRYEDSIFDLSNNQFKLTFHEDYTEPIGKEVHIAPDKEGEEGKNKAYMSVNPSNIAVLLKMEYVKVLAQAQEISKYLQMILVLSGIGLLVGIITAVMLYQKVSG